MFVKKLFVQIMIRHVLCEEYPVSFSGVICPKNRFNCNVFRVCFEISMIVQKYDERNVLSIYAPLQTNSLGQDV